MASHPLVPERPEDLVLLLVKRVRQNVDASLAALPVKLTRLSFGVLALLRRYGADGATITELAARSCVAPPTLVAAVHALERKRLVARRKDAADHRRQPIHLTPAARRLLDKVEHPAAKILADARRRCGARKTKAFLEVLDALASEPATGRRRSP